jgi:hypothetical protein
MKRFGFTLWEALVVVLVVVVIASILWPVGHGYSPGKARQITCTSQVRQLTTAVVMYSQDNTVDKVGRYPGKDWNVAIDTYIGNQKLFFCPSDATSDKSSNPISYGYSGLLVRPDGTGVTESQIVAPTEVGCIADSTPQRVWATGGGLIGGGALMDPTITADNKSVELDPRHNGIIVGFCDGHAKFFTGKQANLRDISYGPGRAFYQAVGLGLISNYGGGLNAIACTPTKHTVTIGGDLAGMPLLRAAAAVWTAKGGTITDGGFTGMAATPKDAKGKPARHFAWVDASDSGKGTVVAQDALVIIVSKNCKLPGLMAEVGSMPDLNAAPADLVRLFGTASDPAKGQVYTYTPASGTRAYLAGKLRGWGAAKGAEFGTGALPVGDDLEMIEKVASDPYGIGYCSAVFADTDKVNMLAIDGKLYPNQNPKYRWLVPETPAIIPGEFEYPLIRILRLRTSGDGAVLAGICTDPAFLDGPLYVTSYFRP